MIYVKFNLTLSENHDDYDLVITEFSVESEDAYKIIDTYVNEPERTRLLNKILSGDEHLSDKERHMREMEELEKIIGEVNYGL